MTEQNNFSKLQRRNSAVMAKYEWTSSLMNMQKSGNEIHDRRTKTHRKANEFLQGLLQKRSDGSLLDDNGTIDRYERFLRFKSNLNDDDTLNEFDRRLRALNRERRQKQMTPNGLQMPQETNTDRDQRQKRTIPVGIQTLRETTDPNQRLKRSVSQGTESDIPITDRSVSQETESDIQTTDRDQRLNRSISQRTESDIQTTDQDQRLNRSISQRSESDIQSFKPTDRIKSLSKSTITSNNSLISNISAETNPGQVRFSINEDISSSPSSTSSDRSMTKTLHRPKVRRADGTELVVNPPRRTMRRASSDILIFNHCHFPRALKPRERMNINVIPEKQEPPATTTTTVEQYDHSQVFELLDQIENDSSAVHFATMLDQLTSSTVPINRIDNNNNNNDGSSIDNYENEHEDNIPIYPNLFDQPTLSQEYYTTFDVNIGNPKNVSLYTMTIGIVQLSPSLIVPYSILNGRRPLLELSVETNFQKIYCKQPKHTSQVTAIDSTINTELLQENDIILKINEQSVWHLTTEAIRDILQQTNDCSLTVVRLCQPLI